MKYNLEIYFLLFIIYSVLGWLMESIKMIFNKQIGHFVNRGFLIGPYLPIYGFGVVAITLFLNKYSNDISALFFLSMITCGILEYFTSYILEKIFNARWWDYTPRKFNINGRICLETLLPFGIAGVIIITYTNPFFVKYINKLPEIITNIINIVFLFIISTDAILSLTILSGLKLTENDLSSLDDTEVISDYVHDKAENMAMQFESDIKHNRRKKHLKRQRKLLHLKLRVNKKINYEYNEALQRTNELKEKISAELTEKLEKAKLSNEELTAKIKLKFSKKSLLHKRLMDAFPTFKINDKFIKVKIKRNIKK